MSAQNNVSLSHEARQRIRTLAEAATPGPWKADNAAADPDQAWGVEDASGRTIVLHDFVNASNAKHIAACDPQTILALCDLADEADRIKVDLKCGECGAVMANNVCPHTIHDNGELEHLRATVSRQWRPIEDSDKDGKPRIVMMRQFGTLYYGYCYFERHGDGSEGWHGGSFASEPKGSWTAFMRPTHCLEPLPDPPPAATGASQGQEG